MAVSFTYMLECSDGSLYVGWTSDLEKRVRAHQAGQGSKYTRSRLPVRLAYFEEQPDKHAAMSREWHLKRLTHEQKRALIDSKEKSLYNK